MPQSNGNLSGLEVAAYSHAAGFSGANSELQTAIAVAMAESKWDPKARGGPNEDGTYDWGLYQINDVNRPSAAEKTDPLANAKKAHAVYKSQGWKAWTTYKNGDYKQYMTIANQSVIALKNRPSFEKQLLAGKNPGSPDNPISGGKEGDNGMLPDGIGNLDPMAGIAGAISGVGNALNTQVGKVAGNAVAITVAVVLLVLGVVILLRQGATNAVGGIVKGALK